MPSSMLLVGGVQMFWFAILALHTFSLATVILCCITGRLVDVAESVAQATD